MKIYQTRVSLLFFFLFCSSLPSFDTTNNTTITKEDKNNTFANPTATEQKIDFCSNHGHKELNCVCQSQWTGPNCEIRSKKYLKFFLKNY